MTKAKLNPFLMSSNARFLAGLFVAPLSMFSIVVIVTFFPNPHFAIFPMPTLSLEPQSLYWNYETESNTTVQSFSAQTPAMKRNYLTRTDHRDHKSKSGRTPKIHQGRISCSDINWTLN